MLLGIILKNENVLGDMIDFLLYLNEYVLCQSQNAVDNLTQKEVCHDAIYEILLGGDQLTRKRMRKGGKMSSLATKLKDLLLSIILHNRVTSMNNNLLWLHRVLPISLNIFTSQWLMNTVILIALAITIAV